MRTRQKNKRGDRKGDLNDSPEIQDMGGRVSDILLGSATKKPREHLITQLQEAHTHTHPAPHQQIIVMLRRVLTSRRATRESWELSPNKEGGAGMKEALEMGPVEAQDTLNVGMVPLLPSEGSLFFNGDSRNRLKDRSGPCKSGTLPPSTNSFLTGEPRNLLRVKSGACKSNNFSTRIRALLARQTASHAKQNTKLPKFCKGQHTL